jgi:transposase
MRRDRIRQLCQKTATVPVDTHPATIAYIQRRLQEGKTRREANRCLKRYLARNLYRLLEHGAPLAT